MAEKKLKMAEKNCQSGGEKFLKHGHYGSNPFQPTISSTLFRPLLFHSTWPCLTSIVKTYHLMTVNIFRDEFVKIKCLLTLRPVKLLYPCIPYTAKVWQRRPGPPTQWPCPLLPPSCPPRPMSGPLRLPTCPLRAPSCPLSPPSCPPRPLAQCQPPRPTKSPT